MPNPQRAASVLAQLPMFRTGDPGIAMSRAVQLAGILEAANNAAARYRVAVLAHPDLARALCQAVGLSRAEAWNGYIPPRLVDGQCNSSPYRAGLVAIVTEALKRGDNWRDSDREWLEPVPERAIRAPWRESAHQPHPGPLARLSAAANDDEGVRH